MYLVRGNDFSVTSVAVESGRFFINSGSNFTTVSIQHTIDGVGQENNETYSLRVSNNINLQNYAFVGTDVTIVDTDSKCSNNVFNR